MKRYISFALCICVCLLLCACNGQNDSTEQQNIDSVTIATDIVTTITTDPSADTSIENSVKDEVTDAPSSSGSTPLFYKATNEAGNTIWLFGSIHVASEDMYPLPDDIISAYENADILAVECDVLAMNSDFSAAVDLYSSMVYTDGTKITDHISEDLYERAVAVFTDTGLYTPVFDSMCPTIWSSTLETVAVEKIGYKAENGLDMYFLNRAYEEEKTIDEIESVDFQMNLLVSFSDEIQEIMLEQTVASLEDTEAYKAQIDELVDIWSSGDEEAFEAYLQTEDDMLTEEEQVLYEEYNQAMIVERNKYMTDYAESCLALGDEAFICVGAAHIVGEGGMVDLLEERGYIVEIV